MKRFSDVQIEHLARTRSVGWHAAVLAAAEARPGFVEISENRWHEINQNSPWQKPESKAIRPEIKSGPIPAPPVENKQPRPVSDWPFWARLVARRKRAGEKGVGDTVQRLASRLGGEGYKRLRKRLGIPCHCPQRQAALNAEFPYDWGIDQPYPNWI